MKRFLSVAALVWLFLFSCTSSKEKTPDLLCVKQNGKWGYVNQQGVKHPRFGDGTVTFTEGERVKVDFDTEGEKLPAIQKKIVDGIQSFCQHLAIVL